MGGLPLIEADRLRAILTGPFEIQGPFIGRDLSTNSNRIRVGGSSATLGGLGGALPGGGLAAVPPRASYQWLFFHELDGASPAGPTTFTIEGPPIGFVGAITEVDVTSQSDPGNWQMRISLEGYGSIFQTSQPLVTLTESGFFRPTPPGFWPETEGLVVPIDSAGRKPVLEFFRPGSVSPNLLVRVLIVAHPAF